jgi:predicted metal-dependent hydrolase
MHYLSNKKYKNFTVFIKRNLKQKHTYLKVKRDGTLEISTNFTTTQKKIFEFIDSRSSWIEKELSKVKQNPLPPAPPTKEKAKEIILPLVEKWSKIMNLTPSFIGFRDSKTRWGSCSAKNRINFSTYLSTMPLEFIEYVVVHELSHIKHKNHSKEFWAEVEKFLPDYKERKKLIFSKK